MKQKLTLLLLMIGSVKFALSQTSISPSPNNEFCPGVDITFTVTIPGSSPTVLSWTNTPVVVSGANIISTSSSSTTFTFVGRFRDVNINQVFRVNYTNSSSQSDHQDFEFKRIKSFFMEPAHLFRLIVHP